MTSKTDLYLQLQRLDNQLEASRATVKDALERLQVSGGTEELAFKLSQAEEARDLWFGKVADLEAANRRLEESLNDPDSSAGLRAKLAGLLETSEDPVSAEFWADGKWWPFQNEDHKRNTIAAGYAVRDLYTRPGKPVKLGHLVIYGDLHGVGKLVSFSSVSAAIQRAGYEVNEEWS